MIYVCIWQSCQAKQKELILSENQKQHGGPRPNSGRPPKDNARMPAPMRLLPDTVAFLRDSGQTLAEATEAIVRKSKAFREWKRKQQPDELPR